LKKKDETIIQLVYTSNIGIHCASFEVRPKFKSI